MLFAGKDDAAADCLERACCLVYGDQRATCFWEAVQVNRAVTLCLQII